jgi:hypothetical protein
LPEEMSLARRRRERSRGAQYRLPWEAALEGILCPLLGEQEALVISVVAVVIVVVGRAAFLRHPSRLVPERSTVMKGMSSFGF